MFRDELDDRGGALEDPGRSALAVADRSGPASLPAEKAAARARRAGLRICVLRSPSGSCRRALPPLGFRSGRAAAMSQIPTTTGADISEAQFVDSLGQLLPRLVEHVMHVTEPMFMLFDFKKFERKVYEDIVKNFVAGRTS